MGYLFSSLSRADEELAKDIEMLMQKERVKRKVSSLFQKPNTPFPFPDPHWGPPARGYWLQLNLTGMSISGKIISPSSGKYGIDITTDSIYGYKLETYLDWIAFGDTIVRIISTFKPAEDLRDFLLAMFSDAISSCELQNGSLKDLDVFIVETTIPKYEKIYGISGK